jgi:UDP-sugar transporter A1/2/3
MILNLSLFVAAISVVENLSSHPPSPSYMKYVTLVSLALHRTAHVISLRYVRTTSGPRFINSTLIWICEVQKAILSLILIIGEERSLIGGLKSIYNKILLEPKDTIKMAIPALIYTVQSNLNLKAISNLDAATFMVNNLQYTYDYLENEFYFLKQVTNQLKIFTTAIFTVIMLHRRLGLVQWFSLAILVFGVCLVEFEQLKVKTHRKDVNVSVGLLFTIGACKHKSILI